MPRSLQHREPPNMKIEHITYDQSRRRARSCSTPLPPPPPPSSASTTSKIRNFLSSQISRVSLSHDYQEQALRSQTVCARGVMGPRTAYQISAASKNLPDTSAYLEHQKRLERAARREEEEEDRRARKTSNRCSAPLLRDGDGEMRWIPLHAKEAPIPKLRRKAKFLGVERGCRSGQKDSDGCERVKTVENLQNRRREMREGKLERVPPPRPEMTQRVQRQYVHPQPPPKNPLRYHPSSTALSSSPKKRKTKSPSGNVLDCMVAGVDVLDETRRELAGKFRPPFEYLSYPSFSLSGQNSKQGGSDNASSESFYCVGDEQVEDSEKVKALRKSRRDNMERRVRLSGEGTNPWTLPPQNCRLCKKPGVRGVRGICEQCESDFMPPRAFVFDSPSVQSLVEIKPTPPLKNKRRLSMTGKSDSRKAALQIDCEETEDQRPRVPVKDEIKLSSVRHIRPKIIISVCSRHDSQKAVVEGVHEEDLTHGGWATELMEAEYDRTQRQYTSLSSTYVSDETRGSEGETDTATLVAEEPMKRQSSFYSFWVGVLDDYEATMRKEKEQKKYL